MVVSNTGAGQKDDTTISKFSTELQIPYTSGFLSVQINSIIGYRYQCDTMFRFRIG